MINIYVLQCENNKYYVGRTNNLEQRIDNHFNNFGSYWTIRYKPIKILKMYHNCDEYDEDKYTLKYMKKYGIDNVRGGSFVRLTLSKYEKKFLIKMIRSSENKCFYCNGLTHYVNDCNLKNVKNFLIDINNEIIDVCNLHHSSENNYIDIKEYVEILSKIDNIIFNNINVILLNKFMNNNEDIIYYPKFTKDLIYKLNKIS